MGDNRPNSRDSRFFGTIPKSLIVGRAFVRVWPLNALDFL
ncbi:MAG: S26 family signal peptidase [Actinomycetota bacterium]|nr:S26 family signal peptidase [Actinomycetota bacterium]